MKRIEIIDWSASINGWYDSLNDAHNNDVCPYFAYPLVYDYLESINDEEGYEWSLNKQSSSPSSGWWGCFLLPQYGNEQTVSPTNTMRERLWIDPEDHAKVVVEQFTLEDLIEYVTQDLVEMYSDMGEWEYEDE